MSLTSGPGHEPRRALTKVLVITQPATLATQLAAILQAEADISVVGSSARTADAAAMVVDLCPDVLIMDVDATGGDPQGAIGQIMRSTPTAILALYDDDQGNRRPCAAAAIDAGAVDAMLKPGVWTTALEHDVRRRVRILRGVTVLRHPGARPPTAGGPTGSAPAERPAHVVGIAASTGGPAALAHVVAGLDGIPAPVLIVQHMHVDFVDGLVSWMARIAAGPVRVAVHGSHLEAGVIYIGPGDVHLRVGPGRRIVLDPRPLTTHRPSADQLFQSMAKHLGPDGIGAVLTGMGTDGAAGLLAMRQRGAFTVCQDEATSAVFGMPKAAEAAGAAALVLPLDSIAGALLRAAGAVRS